MSKTPQPPITFESILMRVKALEIVEAKYPLVPDEKRAVELLDRCRKAGIPFEITHVENLGPFPEAGCSPHSFQTRITVRCPNGVMITSNAYYEKAMTIAASKMLTTY